MCPGLLVRNRALRSDVEQLKQRQGRAAKAELTFASDEGQRPGFLQDERPVVFAFALSVHILARIPLAVVKLHAIDDLGDPDDAASPSIRRQGNVEPPLKFVVPYAVSALRSVD